MDILTEYFDRDGYLLVRVSAPWTSTTASRVIDETRSEARKRGLNRVLFDLTQWTRPNTEMTRFRSGEHLANVMPPPFKIAAFATPSSINHFGENTAVNRGAWFRIFSNERSAVKWLLE